MKLRLNLATVPQANHRPFLAASALGGAAALIALVLLAHAALASWQDRRQLRSATGALESQIRASESEQQQLAVYFHSPQAQQILNRSAFLNSLIDARSFPWTKIFTDLERTLPPGVRVISISPRLDQGRAEVTMQVGAQTGAGEVRFLKAMETAPEFSGLLVQDVKQSNTPDAADKLLIDLTVWYRTT